MQHRNDQRYRSHRIATEWADAQGIPMPLIQSDYEAEHCLEWISMLSHRYNPADPHDEVGRASKSLASGGQNVVGHSTASFPVQHCLRKKANEYT
jgi:hypothetical protein